jgi:hypothetical protein
MQRMDRIKTFASARPRLAAWIALAAGMVIILIIAARDVGLLWNQWLFLILATIGLAGLCVWIIGWESGDEPEDGDAPSKQIAPEQPKPPEPVLSAGAQKEIE